MARSSTIVTNIARRRATSTALTSSSHLHNNLVPIQLFSVHFLDCLLCLVVVLVFDKSVVALNIDILYLPEF